MDFKSIADIKKESPNGLFDLSTPNLTYRSDVNLNSYTVDQGDIMRIDIIFQKIYGLEANEVGMSLENIDIILFINGIDNPLNIIKGQVILYPSLDDMEKFRKTEEQIDQSRLSIKEKLIVPNKSTKKDKNRLRYIEQDYSLPPVVLRTPKAPIRLDGSRMSVGGL